MLPSSCYGFLSKICKYFFLTLLSDFDFKRSQFSGVELHLWHCFFQMVHNDKTHPFWDLICNNSPSLETKSKPNHKSVRLCTCLKGIWLCSLTVKRLRREARMWSRADAKSFDQDILNSKYCKLRILSWYLDLFVSWCA